MISVIVRLGVRSPGMANNDNGSIETNRGASVTPPRSSPGLSLALAFSFKLSGPQSSSFFPRSDPLTYGACSTTISYFPLPSQGLSPHPLVSQHPGCDAHHDRHSSLQGCWWARTEPVAPAVPPHWHVPGCFDKSPCRLACFRTAHAHVTGTHSCLSPSRQLSITPKSSPSCLH